jgi:type I restriction enzyme, S subunit
VYSKIDVRNGAIGVVPPQMPRVAASTEYPVYEVAPNVALPFYIQLLFRTSYFRRAINSMISGASGRKRVQPEQIEAIRVPLPPLSMQQAILKRWDDAQSEITTARHQISTLGRQIESDFLANLGLNRSFHTDSPKVFAMRWKNLGRWGVDINQGLAGQLNPAGGKYPIVLLAEVIADLENGWSPKCLDRPAEGDEWGVLKLGAVSFGMFNERENKALPHKLSPRPELEVKQGDFLISRANITRLVGACALVQQTRPRLMLCDKIFRLVWREPSPVDEHYLDEILKTPHVRQQIENAVTGTSATMKNITKPALLALRFPLPPLDVQRQLVGQIIKRRDEIAKKTERIYHLETAIGQEIEDIILGTRPVPEFAGLEKGTA